MQGMEDGEEEGELCEQGSLRNTKRRRNRVNMVLRGR